MASSIQVTPISGAMGAEIRGVDLATDVSDTTIAEIRGAFLEHLAIFFRDQDLSSAQFMAFASRMGSPMVYPFIKPIDGFPMIIEVKKLENERQNFGGIWHTDTSYLTEPPMGTVVLALEVPPHGGDTEFANQYLAYETLSVGMRRLLDGLVAVNSSAKADVSRTREDMIRTDGRADARQEYTAEHPAVRTHPETGRKALYVSLAHTARFKDMTEAESADLLQFLFAHQTKAELTCRFHWTVGSLAFFDNRCAQHNPINDYHGHRRLLHRISLAGDVPR
jgi:taurine dioxygenase